jgi:hypothetical protein
MAGAFTTDLVTINLCEATTSWTKVNGANIAINADAKVEGTNCLSQPLSTTSGTTDAGYYLAATFDCTNQAIFMWRAWSTASNMRTKANQGVFLHILSDAAWAAPGTNYKRFYLDGSDTNTTGGWKCYVVDPAVTADVSGGSLAVNSIDFIFPGFRQETTTTSTFINSFIDAIRRGTGLTAVDGTDGTPIDLSAIQVYDNATTRAWGVLTASSGIYYGAGKLNFGTSGQIAVTRFKDTNQVLVFQNYPVAATFYAINATGNASFSTTVQFGNISGSTTSGGCVIRGAGTAKWNMTASTYGHIKIYASTLNGLNAATLSASSTMVDTSIISSGTITITGATITNCTFNSPTATALIAASPAEAATVTKCTFNSSGTGYAMQINGTAANMTLTNCNFSGYASSNGSTGNEAIFVNIASGSMNLTISGGNTPSIRTAGAVVTVISGAVSATVKSLTPAGVNLPNSNVMLKATAGGTFPAEVTVTSITNSGTTATVNHTGHAMATNDKVLIKGASHPANNGVFTITRINNDSYSYTMGSAPGSNPTGTIKSTFVVLSGLTDANGEITMSRVFATAQPVTGWVRNRTTSPLYKEFKIGGIVSTTTGYSTTVQLIADQ